MTTLTIEISEKAGKTLAELVEQLGGKVISIKEDKKTKGAIKKKQVLDDLEGSVNFVKLHQQGKVETKTIEELLDEL
jgi:Mor family transcriptional regulator